MKLTPRRAVRVIYGGITHFASPPAARSLEHEANHLAAVPAPLYDLEHTSCDRCRQILKIQIYALRARLIMEIETERASVVERG